MGKKSKWTVPEENFIIKKYHQGFRHAEVKRAMRLEFYGGVQQRKLAETHAPRLYDVVKRLQNKGTYASFSKCDMPKRKANEANVEEVKDFFETNPQKPTSEAAEELNIPKTTVL